jgi:glutathione S-transferase
MAKNIVFCADGTWNGPGKDEDGDGVPDATNVLRLFGALSGSDAVDSLRLQNEQEKLLRAADGSVLQVAKYLHGVGDSRNAIKRLFGGVFGEGFIQRIVRGYTFLSRHHEPGDRIHLVGFSRGAYTARALGGMVTKMGLLDRSAMERDGVYDAETAYKSGTAVWTDYRRRAGKHSTLLGYVHEFLLGRHAEPRLVPDVPIGAIGVWDTVGALGIPVFDVETRDRIDVFQFADTALSPKVARGFHAVSIDEQRKDFVPTWWDRREGVEQVLFVGAHADVGGGYPATDLSCHSLRWMKRMLAGEGVLFDAEPSGPAPGLIPINEPWKKPPFDKFGQGPREHVSYARLHRSVQERLAQDAAYQPPSLREFAQSRRIDAGRLEE